MIAKEAHTSLFVKDLIVTTAEVDDLWQSCVQALEGVRRYHVTLPCEKRGGWLQEHHAEVIQRLNVDYFKAAPTWSYNNNKDVSPACNLNLTWRLTTLRALKQRHCHADHH